MFLCLDIFACQTVFLLTIIDMQLQNRSKIQMLMKRRNMFFESKRAIVYKKQLFKNNFQRLCIQNAFKLNKKY